MLANQDYRNLFGYDQDFGMKLAEQLNMTKTPSLVDKKHQREQLSTLVLLNLIHFPEVRVKDLKIGGSEYNVDKVLKDTDEQDKKDWT